MAATTTAPTLRIATANWIQSPQWDAFWMFSAIWVGHFWHFGNQDFGVLSVYRLRAGQTSASRRRIDKAYTVAMMFFLQPLVYFKAVATSPLGEAFYSYVPVSVGTVTAAAACAVWVAAALTVAIVGFELCAPDRSLPKLVYYVVMLSHPVVLFLVHYRLGLYYFIGYFWSHWLIAIGLVGRINVNYYRNRGLARMQAIGRHLLSVGTIAAVAIALHVVYGRYDVFSGRDYKEVLGAVTPEYQLLLGLVLGLFLAEQLLHYYCDRSLFRFRDPDVRSIVAPLL